MITNSKKALVALGTSAIAFISSQGMIDKPEEECPCEFLKKKSEGQNLEM